VTVRAVPFDVAAPALARELVDGDLRSAGCSDLQRQSVLTVVTELVMNAVLHGDPGEAGDAEPVELDVDDVDGYLLLSWSIDDACEVSLSVTDFGRHGAPRVESPAEGDGGGRGLRLVEALTSGWSADRADGRTTVSAVVAATS
jgi:anti-sigma regulatory factor (Ser/Thr protein kinase)